MAKLGKKSRELGQNRNDGLVAPPIECRWSACWGEVSTCCLYMYLITLSTANATAILQTS